MAGRKRAAKAGAGVGARVAPKAGKYAGKAALKAGKAQAKLARRAMNSREPAGTRFLKYGLFAVAGFAVGALLGRSGGNSSNGDGSDDYSSSRSGGQGGQTWGSGTATGAAHQSSSDPNRTGAERDYSDPSSGPLIGEARRGSVGGVTEQQEEVENRIRTRIGADSRTKDLPRINVEVNDGVAELRGVAPSAGVKDAAGEVAADTEGVREVRNLISVS